MAKSPKSLSDSDIKTLRHPGRRRFLGLMSVGGAAVGAASLGGQSAQAQAADQDNGTYQDPDSCPRGPGGAYTGVTDADDGRITDASGYGRGVPTC